MTVLTDFLGAGNTTLLNRILNGDHGLRVAVLVNDFGSINIDAELVVGVEENMISLANGCVCCQIRDDLIESVEDVLARPEPIEYILLEASGVAEPSGIFATFANPSLRDRVRLDSITCVVDAEQVFAHPEYPGLQELKLRQIAFADMVVLNKVDLTGPEQVERVKAWTMIAYVVSALSKPATAMFPMRSCSVWGALTMDGQCWQARGMDMGTTTTMATTIATRIMVRPSVPGVTNRTGRCR